MLLTRLQPVDQCLLAHGHGGECSCIASGKHLPFLGEDSKKRALHVGELGQ
jgi:hypothetical protein